MFFYAEESNEIGRKDDMAFFSETALGKTRAFRSIDSMEPDVIDDGLSLFNAPDGAGGAFTTGGSESIFIAMKAVREALRAERG